MPFTHNCSTRSTLIKQRPEINKAQLGTSWFVLAQAHTFQHVSCPSRPQDLPTGGGNEAKSTQTSVVGDCDSFTQMISGSNNQNESLGNRDVMDCHQTIKESLQNTI